MSKKRFEMGDYTNCRYSICEILKDGEYYCTVATEDADLIINVLEENERLKQSNKDVWNLIRFIYNEIQEDGYMDKYRIKDLVEFE